MNESSIGLSMPVQETHKFFVSIASIQYIPADAASTDLSYLALYGKSKYKEPKTTNNIPVRFTGQSYRQVDSFIRRKDNEKPMARLIPLSL